MNLTPVISLLQQRFHTTSIVYYELNLLSNVDVKLEQRCNFDVVTSTSLQRYASVVRHYDLTTTLLQRCVFDGTIKKTVG